jgi:DNA-3-methyladenine glycosylase
MKILKRTFYERDTAVVAQELLGKIIVRILDDGTILQAVIVETEAYLGLDDPASHAYGGKRVRNAPLYGPVGHTYVYFTYGMYYCVNFVARAPGIPAGGILIRAVAPILGIEYMEKKRHKHSTHGLTNGPGKLTQALAIDNALNGIDATKKGPLYVIDAPALSKKDILLTTRIGISKAADEKLRFYIKNNSFVSKRSNA